MLTGQMAFQGEDVSLTLSSVLQREPDWSRLPSEVSPSLSVFLHRCLEKDPKRRVHDVADVRLAMEGAFELAPDPESTVSRVGSLRWRALLITTIAASVITGFLVWSLMAQRPGGVPLGPQTTFTVVPPGGAQAESPWLSPDGRAIAFQARPLAFVGLADASGGQIYVRRLEELDAVPLQNTDGTELYGFSPDGQWLLVDRQAELARVPLAGGATIRIGESSGAAHWGFNDRIAQGSTEGLRHISASSGETTQLTTASEGEAHFAPRALPNGRGILFTVLVAGIDDAAQVAVYDFETNEHRTLMSGQSPRYAASGHLVFWRDGSLWAVPFDVERLSIRGSPTMVVESVRMDARGSAYFSLSVDGTLAYVPAAGTLVQQRSLVWVDRNGNEEPVQTDAGVYDGVQLSPDGRRVVVSIPDRGNLDVWVYDLRNGIWTRLTRNPSPDFIPVWTPDAERVVFASTRAGPLNLFSMRADGTGDALRLMPEPTVQAPSHFAPDGTLVFMGGPPETALDVLTIAPDGRDHATALLQADFSESLARVSPDGRWLAYVSNESGQREVYVRPYPNVNEGRWKISNGLSVAPVWSPDGNELFYQTIASDGISTTMMTVSVDAATDFSAGQPVALFEGPYRLGVGLAYHSFDVSPDGRGFLMLKEERRAVSREQQIVVVENWFEELTRLVPTE